MLRALHIRNFVLVVEAELTFDAGFTVFSGETGAGKSILIDALALTLGARADASVLRDGAARAEISAVFDAPESLAATLAALDLDANEHANEELVLRRVIDAQGRSRAYVNGVPATLAQLRELGEALVDIHGQHAHQSLLRAEAQRELLDAHGNHAALRQSLASHWQTWRDLSRQLQAAERDAEARAAERERLQWQIAELERLALQPDEWPQLQTRHARLAHGQALIDGAAAALAALDGGGNNDDDSCGHARLSSATQRIGQLLRHDASLQTVHDALESARIAVTEAVSDLNDYLSRLDVDPQALAEVEARMSAVLEATRKFQCEPEALPGLRDALQARLDGLDVAAIDALRRQAQDAHRHCEAAAAALTQARLQAAADLSERVSRAMADLAMPGGRFVVTLTPTTLSGHGAEQVALHVAAHAGTTPRPLAKVASGGELARISLALSVIASAAARVPTLIFDEVDSGVGGAVAEIVGRLLRELGERHQVLCVTHLPQVAACAGRHFQVYKETDKKTAKNATKNADSATTRSHIVALDAEARVEEIARMLGGVRITQTTRQHAKEMLAVGGEGQ